MDITIFALAACLCGLFGREVLATTRRGICAPNPPNGHFEYLGSQRDLSHYSLRCRDGFKISPPRGDTLLSCRGSTRIKGQTALCTRQAMTCLPSEFKCQQKKECVPSRVVCDGHPNCLDQTDESPAVCRGGLSCTPQPDWMDGDPNFVFERAGAQRNTGIVEYRVGCVEGYKLKGRHRDAPILRCSAGNVIREPRVHCKKIKDGQTCVLNTDYLIENYHDDQLDLDQDNHSEQQPGTVLTVRCRYRGEAVTVYCNVDGTYVGLPDCS